MTAGSDDGDLMADLAIDDISLAWIPGQYKLSLAADRFWVVHQIAIWSVGLRWLTFNYETPISPSGLRLPDSTPVDHHIATVEQPLHAQWMLEHRQDHLTAHEAALLHGLKPGGNDLPTERILIDRFLKTMAQKECIDLHGAADKAAQDANYIQFATNSFEHMNCEVDGHYFMLRRLEHELPKLSLWMSLGGATFCGHALGLKERLPDVICDGAIGRPLGDLVATGLPELDTRVITKATTSRDEMAEDQSAAIGTLVKFEPDLVELGNRPSSHARRVGGRGARRPPRATRRS